MGERMSSPRIRYSISSSDLSNRDIICVPPFIVNENAPFSFAVRGEGEWQMLYDTLENGDRGTNVRKMQQRLRDKQYLADAADGIFGARTEDAVKAYQAQNGFRETGVADEAMLTHLYSSAAPTCNTYIELRDGDSGTMVKKLNARLRELYYTSASASSNYNSDTVAAVKRFQRQLGVSETGVATAELQRQLYSEYAPQYEGYTDHFAGETDERILSAQLQLSSLGYLRPDALTGTLDDLTAQAIRDFQYENGLSVDGILGANTQAALFASGRLLCGGLDLPFDNGNPKRLIMPED